MSAHKWAPLVVAVLAAACTRSASPVPTAAPPGPSTRGPTVIVPDVVGRPPAEGRRLVEAVGLRAEVALPPGADPGLVAAGAVASTDPPAGTAVGPGSTVRLAIRCPTVCAPASLPSTTAGAPCEPGLDAPVVTPTVTGPGGTIRVTGPAFPGAPRVRVLVGSPAEVAGPDAVLAAEATAGCTYDLTFRAPTTPGRYAVFIVFDPAVRLEPPFDLTVQ